MTRVEDRNSVPTQPKNHRLSTRIRMTWNAVLCTSQLANRNGYGQMPNCGVRLLSSEFRFW